MAAEQPPLVFFLPPPGADVPSIARSLADGEAPQGIAPIDANGIVRRLKRRRGFSRLTIDPPRFSLDDTRREVAMEGTSYDTHLHVKFYGNFDELAAPLFAAMRAQGLVCYSVWDQKIIDAWPKWQEPRIDGGFGKRMSLVLERESARLRQTEPDPARRVAMLNAFVKSDEFRAQMAKEARAESKLVPRGRKKTYADLVDCYARWNNGTPSAAELAAVRKLDAKYRATSIAELRKIIGAAPRLKLLTAVPPDRAKALAQSAFAAALTLDIEPAA